jgi:type IV secretory pathway TraG/TraD family ATPase VirD4
MYDPGSFMKFIIDVFWKNIVWVIFILMMYGVFYVIRNHTPFYVDGFVFFGMGVMGLGFLLLLNFVFPLLGLSFIYHWYMKNFLFTSIVDQSINKWNILKGSYSRSVFLWAMLSVEHMYFIIPLILISRAIGISRVLSIFKKESIKLKPSNPHSTFIFSTDKGKITVGNIYRGIFIAGSAGAGKSKSLIEPIIHQAGDKGFSGIVYDVKYPTLAEEVKGSYANSKVKQYIVNFQDLQTSHRVNPVHPDVMTSGADAGEAAITILECMNPKVKDSSDPIWNNATEALIKGTLLYLRNNRPNQCTIPHAISLLLLSPAADQIVKLLQTDDEVVGIISGVDKALGSDKTTSGIFFNLGTMLGPLYTKEVFWVLGDCQGDFTLDLNNPNDPKMLVLGTNEQKVYRPLVSLIIVSAMRQMTKVKDKEGNPTVVVIDEFPSLYYPDFDEVPARVRSKRISTVVCAQGISQLRSRYGQDKSKSILLNLSNSFYGNTGDKEAGDLVSARIGNRDFIMESFGESMSSNNGGVSMSNSKNVSTQRRALVEPNALTKQRTGVFTGFISDGGPDEFIGWKLTPEPERAVRIDPFYQASKEQIDENWIRIKREAKAILEGISLDSIEVVAEAINIIEKTNFDYI